MPNLTMIIGYNFKTFVALKPNIMNNNLTKNYLNNFFYFIDGEQVSFI